MYIHLRTAGDTLPFLSSHCVPPTRCEFRFRELRHKRQKRVSTEPAIHSYFCRERALRAAQLSVLAFKLFPTDRASESEARVSNARAACLAKLSDW